MRWIYMNLILITLKHLAQIVEWMFRHSHTFFCISLSNNQAHLNDWWFDKEAFVLAWQSQLLFSFCLLRRLLLKTFVHTWPCFWTISTAWRHLVFVCSCCLPSRHRCTTFNVTLFSQISSLSPSCHLSAWQHKVMASRCNQDYMLVTHFVHSVAYNVWNRHKIKPVHRWGDNMLLNIHQFSVCRNVIPECCF